jgi:Spy/CpxP family protein refolding chaperone
MLALLAVGVMPASAQETQSAAPGAQSESKGRHEGGKRGFRDGGGRNSKLMSMLNADQKEKFKAIMQASRQQNQPLYEKMKALKEASKGQGSFDEKSKAEFVALRKQISESRKSTHEKIVALLTPEQKVEFEKNKGFGGRGGEGGFGGRRHRGGPGAEGAAAPGGGNQ